MKKILIILLAIAFNVFAQGEGDRIVNPTWKLSSGVLSPTVSTWTLTLPATTFSPSIVTPLIIGGTDTISTLTYKTTTGVGTTGARHIFQVGNNGATEAVTILNSGFMGIGTTAPLKLLDVRGSNSAEQVNILASAAVLVGNEVGIGFSGDATRIKSAIFHERVGGYGSGNLYIAVDSNGDDADVTTADAKVTILQAGSVGLGTTTPWAQYSQVGATPIWYATDSDVNKVRTSLATATDTSAIKIDASATQPIITFKNTIGNGFTLQTVAAGGASFDGALTAVGTLTMPTPFTLGATSVTTTGTKLNYLTSATGITGTASTNLVFSTSPVLVTPTLGAATGTTLTLANQSAIQATITSEYSRIYPYDDGSNVRVMALLDDAGTETTTQVLTGNMWGEPSGGAILNGTTQNYIHVHNAALDFGAGNGSMEIYFKPDNITDANSFLINKETGGIGYGLEQRTNDLWLRFDDNSTDATAIIGTDVLLANTWYHAIVTLNRAGSATLYLNGVSRGTTTISSTTATVSNAGAYTIGSETGAIDKDYAGVINYNKTHNWLLTQSEVTKRWNNGKPHEYVEPNATKGASQTDLLSGWDFTNVAWIIVGVGTTKDGVDTFTVAAAAGGVRINNILTIGKKYTVSIVGSTTTTRLDLYNYAISSSYKADILNNSPQTFTAIDNGLALYANSAGGTKITTFTVTTTGSTFSINNTDWGASGAVCTIGGTKSIANSTAYPIAVSGKYDARKTIAANYEFTGTAKVGSILKYVKITNTIADIDTVSLGTAGGGFEVLNAQIVGASSTVIANVAKWFSDSATQTLYLHATHWASDNLEVVLIYEPIGEKL